jgi:hypothetical protein
MNTLWWCGSFTLSVFLTIAFCLKRRYKYLAFAVLSGVGIQLLHSLFGGTRLAPAESGNLIGTLLVDLLPVWITLGIAGAIKYFLDNPFDPFELVLMVLIGPFARFMDDEPTDPRQCGHCLNYVSEERVDTCPYCGRALETRYYSW